MTEHKLSTVVNLLEKLDEVFKLSIKAGLLPEGLLQVLLDLNAEDYHTLKRKHHTPVEYTRRISIDGRVAAAKKEDPRFRLGMNTSFYAPYKGLTNTVRVHHDFLIYPLGEFKQVMIEEDGTFFVTVDKDRLHVTPETAGIVFAKISTTNPTVGRRYDSTPPVQPNTESNPTGRETPNPTGSKRRSKGVDQKGNSGTSK